MKRTIGDYEVWTAISSDNDSDYFVELLVGLRGGGLLQTHRFAGVDHSDAVSAEQFASLKLRSISGVNPDGTLEFD